MVENYPTCLRVLVLAENAISPELQQQISDLLSEGEEDEDKEAGARGSGRVAREKTTWLPNSSKYAPITAFALCCFRSTLKAHSHHER